MKEFLVPFHRVGTTSVSSASATEENVCPDAPVNDERGPEANNNESEPPSDVEEDYLLVRQPSPAVAIPTMDTSFNVQT